MSLIQESLLQDFLAGELLEGTFLAECQGKVDEFIQSCQPWLLHQEQVKLIIKLLRKYKETKDSTFKELAEDALGGVVFHYRSMGGQAGFEYTFWEGTNLGEAEDLYGLFDKWRSTLDDLRMHKAYNELSDIASRLDEGMSALKTSHQHLLCETLRDLGCKDEKLLDFFWSYTKGEVWGSTQGLLDDIDHYSPRPYTLDI